MTSSTASYEGAKGRLPKAMRQALDGFFHGTMNEGLVVKLLREQGYSAAIITSASGKTLTLHVAEPPYYLEVDEESLHQAPIEKIEPLPTLHDLLRDDAFEKVVEP